MLINDRFLQRCFKRYSILKTDYAKFPLTKTTKVAIGQCQMSANNCYFTYSDGQTKWLVVGKSQRAIYAALMDFELRKLEIVNADWHLSYKSTNNIWWQSATYELKVNASDLIPLAKQEKDSLLFKDIEQYLTTIKSGVCELKVKIKVNNKTYIAMVPLKLQHLTKTSEQHFDKHGNGRIDYKIKRPLAQKIKMLEKYIATSKFNSSIEYVDDVQAENEFKLYQKDPLMWLITYNNSRYLMWFKNEVAITELALKEKFEQRYKKVESKPPYIVAKTKVESRIILDSLQNTDKYRLRKYQQAVREKDAAARHYWELLTSEPIDEKLILLDSIHGRKFDGNMFYAALAFNQEFPDYKLVIGATKQAAPAISEKLERYQIKAKVVVRNKDYYQALRTAKYLLTDSTLPYDYIKREGQYYINTWHGTPMKTMGKDNFNELYGVENTQRNFFTSDLLVYNSPFQQAKLTTAYMVEGFEALNQQLMALPLFSYVQQETDLRSEMGFKPTDKLVFWMPTWRRTKEENAKLYQRMNQVVATLPANYKVVASVHQLANNKVDPQDYSQIHSVDPAIDNYHLIKQADLIITDYSSVMFDAAILNKKIILDIFDYADYVSDRGLFVEPTATPFTCVKNMEELKKEILTIEAVDYLAFNQLYNPFVKDNAAVEFVKYVMNHENYKLSSVKTKTKVLVYLADLTQLTSFIEQIDVSKVDYYVLIWQQKLVGRKWQEQIKLILENGLKFIVSNGQKSFTAHEQLVWQKHQENMKLTAKEKAQMKKIYQIKQQMIFGNVEFDHLIYHSGNDVDVMKLFLEMKGEKYLLNKPVIANYYDKEIYQQYSKLAQSKYVER